MKKRVAIIVSVLACLALFLCLSACGEKPEQNSTSKSSSSSSSSKTTFEYDKSAVVKVKGYDEFVIQLDSKDAPISVENFENLVKSGFYDGLTFHRLVDGFCLQGGDPNGDGSGNADKTIKGEFSSNKVDNPLADNYQVGTVAMARSSANDSASCQWFITLSSKSSTKSALNGKYAAFGMVDSDNMKIVKQIVNDYKDKVSDGNGSLPKANQPVIEYIKMK